MQTAGGDGYDVSFSFFHAGQPQSSIMSGRMRGFWKRPAARTYSYNLDVGEHYYMPMTVHLRETERGSRGEGPGEIYYSFFSAESQRIHARIVRPPKVHPLFVLFRIRGHRP